MFLKREKIIKIILSSLTRIGLIIYIKDPKKAFSINHVYIKEDTKVKKTIIADIVTTSHSVKSNTMSVINWNTS